MPVLQIILNQRLKERDIAASSEQYRKAEKELSAIHAQLKKLMPGRVSDDIVERLEDCIFYLELENAKAMYCQGFDDAADLFLRQKSGTPYLSTDQSTR